MIQKLILTCLLIVTLFACASSDAKEGIKDSAKKDQQLVPEVSASDKELSFWDLPYLEHAYISTKPSHRKDDIAVGKLGNNGTVKTNVVKLAKEVAKGDHGLYDSLLISHQGKLVFESYYRRARVDLAHGQASATKAHNSIVLGRAIQLGYLTMADLDKPLISFLKDLDTSKFVKGAEKITLHKALIMHGGLSISEEQRKALNQTPNKLKGQGQIQALLEQSAPITNESQKYKYGNFNPTMVMQVIEAVVPGTAQDFIKKELLDKMDITNYDWKTAASGLPEAGWGVSFTSRDMLKWGTLLANKGKWQGEQFISADYLAKATQGITKPTEDWMPENYLYGYFIYQTDIPAGEKHYSANFAWGGGGQYVISVEELELIIVITGHDREDKIMTELAKRVIPEFAPM